MRPGTARRGARTASADLAQGDWMRSRLRLAGVVVLGAKLFLVPLALDPSSDWPFVVPKALLSHGLSYVLAGVIAGLLLQHGRAFVVWSRLHIPVLAFLAANVAATVFAANLTLALYGTHARMLGLGTIADGVILYFAIVMLVRTRVEAAVLIACGLGAAGVVFLYEMVQLAGRDPFVWNPTGHVNPFSTLGQPTVLAEYLTVLAVGVIALGALLDSARWRARIALLLYGALLIAGAAATGTRSSIVGIGTGGVTLVTLLWMAHPSRRARAMNSVFVAGAALAVAILLLVSPVGSRLTATINTVLASDGQELASRLDPSTASRLSLYTIGFQMVRERPIFGYGPDNFVVGVPKYRSDTETPELQASLPTSVHGWAGSVAIGSGVLGLAAFLAIAAVALTFGFRAGVRPVAGAATAMLGAFLGSGVTTVSDIGSDWLFWASAGAIAAISTRATARETPDAASRRGRSNRGRTRSRSWLTDVGAVACAVAGTIVALSAVNALDASHSAQRSLDSRAEQAIDFGLRATRSDPGRAEYWHALGIAYVGVSRWSDASSAFDRASKLTPFDARNLGDMATAQLLLARAGDAAARAKALELGDRVVNIDPNNPQAQLTRALVMQVTGNLPEALRSIERALALDEDSTNIQFWITATQINLDLGYASEAVSVARKGIAIVDRAELTVRSAPLRYELARALLADGQTAQALSQIDLVLAILPNYPAAERLRAQIHAQP